MKNLQKKTTKNYGTLKKLVKIFVKNKGNTLEKWKI